MFQEYLCETFRWFLLKVYKNSNMNVLYFLGISCNNKKNVEFHFMLFFMCFTLPHLHNKCQTGMHKLVSRSRY